MSDVDSRGCALSGATPAGLASYERALAAYQGWREGADTHVVRALHEAPGLVMGHALQAYLLLCSRDPQRVRSAAPVLARAAALRANPRERLHLAAIGAALGDDYESAKARLGDALRLEPRDALALQAAHALDYVTGDVVCLNARVADVLPAWTRELPGYHAVLAMHAFGLEENGDHEEAEAAARTALALNPSDARAHHVMAHVFEMTGRPAEGERWLRAHEAVWAADSTVVTHGWWHLALFELAQQRIDRAFELYDRRIRQRRSAAVADLIDASALLWRIRLAGGDPGARWHELAAAWAVHVDDRFCSFNDLHAMLAFVGAGDVESARRLEATLAAAQSQPTRHGRTTREIGLPACRALLAFGRGDDMLAITLLASLPALAHRIGGSHAQRDVLHLTLLRAIEHVRRPWRGHGARPVAVGAAA